VSSRVQGGSREEEGRQTRWREEEDERPVLVTLACPILTLAWTALLLLDVWTVPFHDVDDGQTSVKRAPVEDVIRQSRRLRRRILHAAYTPVLEQI
jgi:hypothetical protein